MTWHGVGVDYLYHLPEFSTLYAGKVLAWGLMEVLLIWDCGIGEALLASDLAGNGGLFNSTLELRVFSYSET